MADAVFSITQAGPLVTYQDAGRNNLLRFGVPKSGPMDRVAFASANAAVGNRQDATAIEISLGGLALECVSGEVTFAVAGGGFAVTIDGVVMEGWSVSTIRAGQKLSVSPGALGSWAYLVFAGQLQAHPWLGSTATHEMTGLGGGALKVGDRIAISRSEVRGSKHGPIVRPHQDRSNHTFHVVQGPQDHHFGDDVWHQFLDDSFTLSNAYNRMGVRLDGSSLKPSANLDMPSQPIVRGSVQVAGDGVATVLLSDHQTTGGYPKIATLLSTEIDRFVQLRSGELVKFTCVTPDDAVRLVRSHAAIRAEHLVAVTEGPTSLLERLMSENLISGVVGH